MSFSERIKYLYSHSVSGSLSQKEKKTLNEWGSLMGGKPILGQKQHKGTLKPMGEPWMRKLFFQNTFCNFNLSRQNNQIFYADSKTCIAIGIN